MHRNPPVWAVMGNIEVNNPMDDLKTLDSRRRQRQKKYSKIIHILPLTTTSVGGSLRNGLGRKA